MKLSDLFSAASRRTSGRSNDPPPAPAPTPEQSRRAAELLDMPMAELVRSWLAAINGHPERWQGSLRRRASPEQCAQFEQRLGVTMPADLRAFYEICNGVSQMSSEFPHLLLPVQALVPGHQHRPPLSRQCAQRLTANAGEASPAPGFPIIAAPLLPTTVTLPTAPLTPEAADQLLALDVPRAGRAVTMVIDASFDLPAGVVIELDGLSAICHDSLSHWLASHAAQLTRPRQAA